MRHALYSFLIVTVVLQISFPVASKAESVSALTKPAIPTPQQVVWQDYEIGMFIHFAPNTWQDQEGDDLSTPLNQIDPTQLDTDQWVQVAENMGAKYIVFVAKHVGGFCLWPTETTDYSIAHTPWRDGKGDVLGDLARSCHERGIKLGVYLSPADRKHKATVGGRCETEEEQNAYNELYRRQLTEVLSRYGTMVEVWFDGSLIVEVGDILRRYAPNAMIFQGPYATIRWVGNEEGVAPYPGWNSVKAEDGRTGVATAVHGDPDGAMWLPLECDARIRQHWFWNSQNHVTLKSVEQLMEMYYKSVGHGATLLLNHTPDPTGRIPEADAKRAAEFYAEVQRRFAQSLAETSGKGSTLELDLQQPATIDHVITMEDIAFGERVRDYVIEGLMDGAWKEICRGTAIGHKKIDRFDPVTVSSIRFRAIQSVSVPLLRKFAIYNTLASGPQQTNAAVSRHTLLKWKGADLGQEWRTISIDLCPFCDEAGQYNLYFEEANQPPLGVEIDSVVLVIDGREAPEFVEAARQAGRYRVNITGVDTPMQLKITWRAVKNQQSAGQIVFSRGPVSP